MMRKALLVIALVAASFAGGAAVNGPGLAWLKNALGLTAIEVEAPAEAPRAKRLPMAAEQPKLPSDAPDIGAAKPAERAARGPVSPTSVPLPGQDLRNTTAVSRGPADTLASRPSVSPPGRLTPPPLQPPSSEPATKGAEAPASSPWADAPGSAPARAFLPEREPENAPAPAAARPDPAVSHAGPFRDGAPASPPEPSARPESDHPETSSWSTLSKRMGDAGVERFWIEGQPGKPVRVRCVVPLVGGAAVSQLFEVEALDPESAVDLVLRRIVLWRASEAGE